MNIFRPFSDILLPQQVLVKHANLPEALEEMCDTLKTKKDPVRQYVWPPNV